MSGTYRYEKWICERCDTEGIDAKDAEAHLGHPAGWKLGGNQHPELYRFDPKHPDRVKGFYWTTDWDALRAPLERPESAIFPSQLAS